MSSGARRLTNGALQKGSHCFLLRSTGRLGDLGKLRKLSERYDANNDGRVSQEEIDANRTQWHADFDRDKSGDLSLAEFEQLWLKARREEMVREYQDFDRDGDSKVTAMEYTRPMSNTVANMDRNGDGVISQDDRRWRGRRGQQEQPAEEPQQPQQ
jgi:Ca2+-binding EF-hand superfamily protein